MSEIRVVVVDDHELFRVGLASLLAEADDIDVVGQASSGPLAVRSAGEVHPDVVLLALSVPDGGTSAATRQIVAQHPGVRVIVLAGREAEGGIGVIVPAGREVESGIGAALSAGACGYLSKDMPLEEIVAAMRAAASGHAWLSPGAARAVLRQRRPTEPQQKSSDEFESDFSPRELDVLRLLAGGLTTAAIAAELDISPVNVRRLISSIADKTDPPSGWPWHRGSPGPEGLGGVREPRRPRPETGGGSARLQPPQP
jgi:DNA-binding NarL/FixJ family response regulator